MLDSKDRHDMEGRETGDVGARNTGELLRSTKSSCWLESSLVAPLPPALAITPSSASSDTAAGGCMGSKAGCGAASRSGEGAEGDLGPRRHSSRDTARPAVSSPTTNATVSCTVVSISGRARKS